MRIYPNEFIRRQRKAEKLDRISTQEAGKQKTKWATEVIRRKTKQSKTVEGKFGHKYEEEQCF